MLTITIEHFKFSIIMSLYSNNHFKFVAVLNKKEPLPRLLNALAHTTAGLVAQEANMENFHFMEYVDGSDSVHPQISEYPFIILSAKSSGQLRTLRNQAKELGLLSNDFVDTMIGSSCEEQLNQTRQTKEADLNYYVVALFGPAEVINSLTKKFSLFKSSAAAMPELAAK